MFIYCHAAPAVITLPYKMAARHCEPFVLNKIITNNQPVAGTSAGQKAVPVVIAASENNCFVLFGLVSSTCTIDQHRILFYKKVKCHNSILLHVFSKVCNNKILSVAAKYGLNSLNVSASGMKLEIWKLFVDICIYFL